MSQASSHRFHKCVRQVVASAFFLLVVSLLVLVVCDYLRVKRIRSQATNANPGVINDVISDVIGNPDSISSGTFTDQGGRLTKGYTVWTYSSRFDWVGFRARSDETSIFNYWCSRLNPVKNGTHDTIVEMWFIDGKLEHVVESNSSDVFGQHSQVSF